MQSVKVTEIKSYEYNGWMEWKYICYCCVGEKILKYMHMSSYTITAQEPFE